MRNDGSNPLTSLRGPSGDAPIKQSLEKLTSNGICNCNAKQPFHHFAVLVTAADVSPLRRRGQGREARVQRLCDKWGGVTLVYRKTLQDSPAYRLNHEEVEKSLEEGVRYVENLSPTEAVLDKYGHVKAMKFRRNKDRNAGFWTITRPAMSTVA